MYALTFTKLFVAGDLLGGLTYDESIRYATRFAAQNAFDVWAQREIDGTVVKPAAGSSPYTVLNVTMAPVER